ncbi:MAG TPA: SLC13 family permease, partial [Thermoanaerobaculia bacterium]|nr:SLC13 family permease [Thermoanaerobaculia bacterium]
MMGWEAIVTILVVGLILYGMGKNVATPDALFLGGVAVLMSFSLLSERFPSPREMAAAFGNEGLLTVAALFVVAAGLTETGALARVTERLLGRPKSPVVAQIRTFVPVAGLSAFLNNTPVVAMFIPIVQEWCRRNRISPSKIFIPISYAAVLGGMCTLIGTSTNLVVKGLMDELRKTDPTIPEIGMFTLTPIGVTAMIVGGVFVVIAAPRLLPDRKPASEEFANPREFTVEMMVESSSPVDGISIEAANLRSLPGLFLIEIQREEETIVAVGPDEILRGGDRLIFAGIVESIVDLQRIRGLVPATNQVFKLGDPKRMRCLIEAVVSTTSPLVDKSIRQARFRNRYDAAVIAVHRNGQRLKGKLGDIVIRAGDTLLLEAHNRFLERHRNDQDFLLVSRVSGSEPRRHDRSGIALTILALMVAGMSFESVTRISVFNMALLAAGAMVATRCLSLTKARQSLDLPTLLAIGASFGVGRAMDTTGAADAMAAAILSPIDPAATWAPIASLAGVYLATLLFTEVATNNAAAALAFPIALGVA